MVQCVKDVNVRNPSETALITLPLLVGQHCDEDGVGVDLGVFDVVFVCQAMENVLCVMLDVAWRKCGGGHSRGGGGTQ